MNSLDELILKWNEGNLSGDELRQLNALLSREENRQILREEFLLTAGLRADAITRNSNVVPMAQRAHSLPSWGWITAAAACVALCAMMIRLFVGGAGSAVLGGGGEHLYVGDVISTAEGEEKEIRFDEGKSSIQLRPGSRIEIVSIGSQKRFRLQNGSITAAIAPQREPLLIDTPQAEAIVLGTQFVLSALPKSTRLDVAQGKVRFKRMLDGQAIEVSRNQFATVSPELVFASRSLPPPPWKERDIGAVGMHGVAFVEGSKCLIKGAGRNTCLKKDQLHYMFQKTEGDFEFRARLVRFSARSENARAGIMVRRNLQTACRQAFISFRGDQQVEIQCRPDSDSRELYVTSASLPLWLRVKRQGHHFAFATSKDGIEWEELASDDVQIGDTAFTGLAVTSFDNEVLDESLFDNVSVLDGAR